MQSYYEFLDLSVDFPQEGFEVVDDELFFNSINLMEIIETYGTPLRFTYLPIISKKIQKARLLFQTAMLKCNYRGSYTYAYCTKSSHFRYILEEALKNDVQLETSSAFDMAIIEALEKKGLIKKDIMVICNGFKRDNYMQYIVDFMHDGFTNIIPILDNKEEFNFYTSNIDMPYRIGVRLAVEEQPDYELYTSRFGIRSEEIIELYHSKISRHPNVKLVMLHFFINSGIRDTPYFWSELERCVEYYCKLKKICPDLHVMDIGGGMPYRNSLFFDFDYEYMISEITARIKDICNSNEVMEPDLVTEFGSYTVAESSGILFKVLGRKQQNDREKWLIIDNSLMTTLPDIWAIKQKYILLPINNWDADYERVNLGGITCDSHDYYNHDAHINVLFLPKTRKVQYLGFFHTGAYQEALSGYGGIHHCLIPNPRHLLIRRNKDETFDYEIFTEEQNSKQVLRILGF